MPVCHTAITNCFPPMFWCAHTLKRLFLAAVEADAPASDPPAAVPASVMFGEGATIHLHIEPYGWLVYYESSNDFYAYCNDPDHRDGSSSSSNSAWNNACRKVRTANAGNRRFQGRPLGFLTFWLMQHCCHSTAKAHQKKFFHDTELRISGRNHLKSVPGSDALFKKERELRENEAEEPDALPSRRIA